ncbi:MAG: hypothetical protein ACHQPI_03850 [Thermoanaerobaculia bacterium]
MKLPDLSTIFEIRSFADLFPLAFATLLLFILIVSFRSRAIVFCQYLKAMTGVELKPKDVRRVFKSEGQDGVRSLFLDLIIREDLKEGPLQIPEGAPRPPSPQPTAVPGKPKA